MYVWSPWNLFHFAFSIGSNKSLKFIRQKHPRNFLAIFSSPVRYGSPSSFLRGFSYVLNFMGAELCDNSIFLSPASVDISKPLNDSQLRKPAKFSRFRWSVYNSTWNALGDKTGKKIKRFFFFKLNFLFPRCEQFEFFDSPRIFPLHPITVCSKFVATLRNCFLKTC